MNRARPLCNSSASGSPDLGLTKVGFELVAQREKEAVCAAERVGFKEVATLEDRVKDFWGNYQDLIMLEIPVADRERWWKG